MAATKKQLAFIAEQLDAGKTLVPIMAEVRSRRIRISESAVRKAIDQIREAKMQRRDRHWDNLLTCKKVKASDVPCDAIKLF